MGTVMIKLTQKRLRKSWVAMSVFVVTTIGMMIMVSPRDVNVLCGS